jgi:hypothetical protein
MLDGAKSASRIQRWVAAISIIGGILLTVIGARYFITPEGAAYTFGIPRQPQGHEFHYVIGLRNLWLGLLAIAFAALREWRALALWFVLGTFVCFADAAIAATATGRIPQVAFHMTCGIGCIVLAALNWRLARRRG